MWKCIGFNCHAIYTFFPHVMEVLIKLIWATQLWLLSFVIKPIWRVNFAIFFRQKEKKKCSTHFPAWAIINSLFSMVFFLSSLCKNSPTARKKKKKKHQGGFKTRACCYFKILYLANRFLLSLKLQTDCLLKSFQQLFKKSLYLSSCRITSS